MHFTQNTQIKPRRKSVSVYLSVCMFVCLFFCIILPYRGANKKFCHAIISKIYITQAVYKLVKMYKNWTEYVNWKWKKPITNTLQFYKELITTRYNIDCCRCSYNKSPISQKTSQILVIQFWFGCNKNIDKN